ncbi:MAG: 4Fe-4S dicluster domain-containing protein [Longimicrobiales bacterium]|nr:4Fe-4S dicluster domain-containing protein [Longimicrobiales bacterium]
MSAAILIDITRCTGCEECVLACKEENDLGPDRLRHGQEAVNGLSSSRFSTILRYPDDHFVRQQCRHCLEPACVSACLVGAMQKTPEGPVIYDSELCMGCRYCLVACPYGVPRYEWDSAAPLVKKCTLCYPRIIEGKEPACVEACPEEALLFGERDDLLTEARRRIAENPGTYLNHIYGETEVGGTSVLYLADISLGFLGWAENLGDADLPHLTHAALQKVPWMVAGMGSLMGGIYWVINRRMKLAARAAEEFEAAVPMEELSPEAGGQSDE